MALIHQATIRPTKLELLDAWAPTQPWFEGAPGAGLTLIASFRFDDPDGEVGVETLLVRAGDGPVLQVPLTYRGAPLEGADAWLIATLEHSVLGPRWVYDALGDPVYRTALTTTAFTGGREADQWVESNGAAVQRESTATVIGSGSDVEGPAGKPHIDLVRAPDTDAPDLPPVSDGSRTEILTGTWTDHGTRSAPRALPRVLARVRVPNTKVHDARIPA